MLVSEIPLASEDGCYTGLRIFPSFRAVPTRALALSFLNPSPLALRSLVHPSAQSRKCSVPSTNRCFWKAPRRGILQKEYAKPYPGRRKLPPMTECEKYAVDRYAWPVVVAKINSVYRDVLVAGAEQR